MNVPNDFVNISIIDGKGKILFPGFLDSHVHIIGGGGEVDLRQELQKYQ